ncbi:hypothetical protein DPMN_058325 [Dreissena polymorpha]|uniref:Uncharacterized protein n=1 Tax=Dreissena polymorpha TaxID=45954 RepID=A0A9D4C1J1_DREPO|nr:hypothetical protein DPMN_058325 [Dreissena polymorpha]
MSSRMKPVELQKDALGDIHVFSESQMLTNLGTSARDKLIREKFSLKEPCQTAVKTCDYTTLASSGLPAKPEGRASGKKELIYRYSLKLKVTIRKGRVC